MVDQRLHPCARAGTGASAAGDVAHHFSMGEENVHTVEITHRQRLDQEAFCLPLFERRRATLRNLRAPTVVTRRLAPAAAAEHGVSIVGALFFRARRPASFQRDEVYAR
jgi:hypothetical protein